MNSATVRFLGNDCTLSAILSFPRSRLSMLCFGEYVGELEGKLQISMR
jgi:hypothetical protein